MVDISNEERLAILEAARSIGFNYHGDGSGRLVCTIDQLVKFSSSVAVATAEQIITAFNGVK